MAHTIPELTALNGLLRRSLDTGDPSDLGEACTLMLQDADFLDYIQHDPTFPTEVKAVADLHTITHRYLYRLLYIRDYASAALLLWGPDVFSPLPRSVKLVWSALFGNNLTAVMGGSAQGKSYGAAAWTLLDWLLDPEYTRIEVISTDSQHLKKNLWGDIQRLYAGAAIAMPGTADALSIYFSEQSKKSGFGFFVVFAERGQDSKGKLKGGHLRPRTGQAHPLFGRNSRRRILIDEAQEVPASVFDDIPNIVASTDGVEHVKVFTAANPKDEFSRYGINCRPPGGWASIDRHTSETWTSETGWAVVRLNAMLSENVVEKRVVFQRMQTYEGVQKAIKAAGGDPNAPSVWTFVYGMFPPMGLLTSVIKKHHLDASYGEAQFTGSTTNFAAFDPAFTGDLPAMATGRTGLASGVTKYDGTFVAFDGPTVVSQIDTVGILSRGDTQDLADQVMERCKTLRVTAENFAIDKTGPGLGVHDIIRRQWNIKVNGIQESDPRSQESCEIMGISYGGKPTETMVMEEDTKTPQELYTNIVSEMWFAAGRLFEFGRVFIGRGVDTKTVEELAGRQGGTLVGKGEKSSIEPKDLYKARGRASPDRADAVTMLLQVMRVNNSDLRAKAPESPDEAPEINLGEWVKEGIQVQIPIYQQDSGWGKKEIDVMTD